MQHTRETIQLLSKTQYAVFCFGRKTVQFLCGLILIWLGITGGGTVMTVVCLFAGCWLCMNTDTPAKVRAGKVIDSMKGKYPYTEYSFEKKDFILIAGESREQIPYTSLIRLVEDEAYLYLYISKVSAYMVEKASARPDLDTVRQRIAAGSGLKWTRPTSFLNFSLRTLMNGRRSA